MSNKRDPRLRTFIRLDGNGQTIPGSVVERFKRPRQGRWQEIAGDPCCTGVSLTATPSSVTGSSYTLVVKCDATSRITVPISGTSTTITTLVAMLNAQAGYLGLFGVAADQTDIELELKATVATDLACTGTLSFTI